MPIMRVILVAAGFLAGSGVIAVFQEVASAQLLGREAHLLGDLVEMALEREHGLGISEAPVSAMKSLRRMDSDTLSSAGYSAPPSW